jgi:hypothetical protein
MDSFAYGKARRRRSRLKPVSVVFGVLLVAAAAAGVLGMTRKGGEAVVRHMKDATKQVEPAQDVEAQASLRSALSAAMTAIEEGGSLESAGAEQLSALEPALTYVDGSQPSTAATVVSIEATEQAWGAAALSSSGTCFFTRTIGTAQAFGSGDPCTGEAAMGATGSHF